METFKQSAFRLLHDEDGATMVEYGLLVALIAVALIATLSAFRTGVQNNMGKATDVMK